MARKSSKTFYDRASEWVHSPDFFDTLKSAIKGSSDVEDAGDGAVGAIIARAYQSQAKLLMDLANFVVPKITPERAENLGSRDVQINIQFSEATEEDARNSQSSQETPEVPD